MSGQDHKQALPTGFRLGNYRVAHVLGAGGFGVTYLCEHVGLGVQVAVKEYLPNEIAVRDGTAVHPKSGGDREDFERGLSRFLEEARTLARFEHPNVVRVRDCFEANSTAYIVMDYEDGESLNRLLERLGTLTETQLKRVVLPVAEGLRQVHAAGFLHRDIKPSNIFVRRSDETPVLLDFGSARQALGHGRRSMTAIASGGYSPPEQYESGDRQGAWTDVYALSALCYRAIVGEVPVEAPRRTGEVVRSGVDPQGCLAVGGVTGYSSGLLAAVDWGLRLIETERPSLDSWLVRVSLTEEEVAANRRAARLRADFDVRRLADDLTAADERDRAVKKLAKMLSDVHIDSADPSRVDRLVEAKRLEDSASRIRDPKSKADILAQAAVARGQEWFDAVMDDRGPQAVMRDETLLLRGLGRILRLKALDGRGGSGRSDAAAETVVSRSELRQLVGGITRVIRGGHTPYDNSDGVPMDAGLPESAHNIATKPRSTVAGAPPAFIERLEQELGWQQVEAADRMGQRVGASHDPALKTSPWHQLTSKVRRFFSVLWTVVTVLFWICLIGILASIFSE